MQKRVTLILFTVIGTIIGAALSLFLDVAVFDEFEVPRALAMGIYYALPAGFAAGGAILATVCAPIVPLTRDRVFTKCAALMLAVAIAGSFVVGAGMQLLYGLNAKGGKTAVILMDVSYSMMGDTQDNAVAAAEKMVNSLDENDRCALIFFDDGTNVVQKLDYVTESVKENMLDKLSNPQRAGAGNTNITTALEGALTELGDDTEESGIFVITDAVGMSVTDDVEKEINEKTALYALNISGESNNGSVLRELCGSSGGMYAQSNDPNEIETLYMELFEGFYGDEQQLNHVRSGGAMPEWYYILILAAFYVLLGAVMMIAYTILYNNRKVVFIWNIGVGVAAAAIAFLSNEIFGSAAMMVIAFVIVYPTAYIGENVVVEPSETQRMYAPEYILR